eukprot:680701-Prorocentrum_minimum.AAC.1
MPNRLYSNWSNIPIKTFSPNGTLPPPLGNDDVGYFYRPSRIRMMLEDKWVVCDSGLSMRNFLSAPEAKTLFNNMLNAFDGRVVALYGLFWPLVDILT